MTPAQKRILNAVTTAGSKTLTARARRPVEALVAAGLVNAEWFVVPDALRGRHAMHVTVTLCPPKGKEKQ